jgi:FdhD protein
MNGTEVDGVAAGSIIRRKVDGTFDCVRDEVVVEEPLEIRIDHQPVAVTMRTPGHDDELAAGFLLSEGIVRKRADLLEIAHCALPGSFGNILNVALAEGVKFNAAVTHRFGSISTSCGLCGKTSIDLIRRQFSPLLQKTPACLTSQQLLQMPGQLRREQGNFARTGGIHAAGMFENNGNLVLLREDLGRHNAVDKVIGHAFLGDHLPLSHHTLLVSGRTSLEIVQKALAAGIGIVASVSAPSTLAINFARETGQTLIGFLRPPTFNVYSHVERVALS